MIGLLMLLPGCVFTIMSGSGKGRTVGAPVAPLFFVAIAAFLLFWQELNDASWMIGCKGWSFTTIDWRQDWLLTTGGMAAFAALVRYFTVDSSGPDTSTCGRADFMNPVYPVNDFGSLIPGLVVPSFTYSRIRLQSVVGGRR